MRAGAMDRRVTLQNRVLVTDNEGNTMEEFTDLAEVYAGRRDTLGSERIASGAEVAVADAVFRIRWRSDIGTTTQLKEGDMIWDVLAQAELGRRDGLDLTCRRVTI